MNRFETTPTAKNGQKWERRQLIMSNVIAIHHSITGWLVGWLFTNVLDDTLIFTLKERANEKEDACCAVLKEKTKWPSKEEFDEPKRKTTKQMKSMN